MTQRLDPIASLNPQQRDAVEHGLNEPGLQGSALLIIAGAGSGKTMTLACRLARLVLAGADPNRILSLTFSRRAAAEMANRAGHVLHQALGFASNQQAPVLSWSGTFHAIGARLLREYAGVIGLNETFTILDRGDAEDLMGLARQQLGLGEAQGRARFPQKGTCMSIYSRLVNTREDLQPLLLRHFPWCAQHADDLQRLFSAYVIEKQRQAVLDFDDLLVYWVQMMSNAELGRHIGSRFDHVLVDEYQDTSRLQEAILLGLKPHGRGLTVVGDDAQSIYSFRAAEVQNILGFPKLFETNARVVMLERNYRSTQPILEAANAMIAIAPERFAKELWTDRLSSERPQLVAVQDDTAQARWIADRVLEHREAGLKLKSQAVLFRASHHSAPLELELARRNIPFVKFGGLQFLEAAHVKDVLAVLRWAQNPRGRLAGFRVAHLVPGIGAKTVLRLMDAMEQASDPALVLQQFVPPPGAKLEWAALTRLVRELGSAELAWPQDVKLVCAWYQPHLERLHEDARIRQLDLTQLARIAAVSPSRHQFLTDMALDPPAATSDESGVPLLDEDYLILSTMHSAKGMEWQSVHVLNVVDGCIPSDMATGDAAQIEEERRLLYVAMTRAKQHLHLLIPQRFYISQQATGGDRHVYGALSRFIPESISTLFDWVGPKGPQSVQPASQFTGLTPIDLSRQILGTWRA